MMENVNNVYYSYIVNKSTPDINKKLCEKMPYLAPKNVWTGKIEEDYDFSYVEGQYNLPQGWFDLFIQMCEDIRQPLIENNYLNKFIFSQIKEKYGTMRCYNFGAPEKVQEIIYKYEYVSGFVCERCGKPAYVRSIGWIENICKDCLGKLSSNSQLLKIDFLKFNPVYKEHRYKNGREYSKEVDCSDIWDRYLKKIGMIK